MRKVILFLVASVGIFCIMGSGTLFTEEKIAEHGTAAGKPTEFRIAAVRYEGTVLWLPSTLIVKKGQKVKINLINNVPEDPNNHGFSIDEFAVKEVVDRGKPKQVEFIAKREGLFSIYCHLHPAHIGGQLLVIK